VHAQLIDLGGVGQPGLAEVLLDVAPGRGDGRLRLPLAFVGRALGGTGTAAHRQRDVEAQADDGLAPAHAVLQDIRSGREARDAVRTREIGLQAELLGLEHLHPVGEVAIPRGSEELVEPGGVLEREHRRLDDERGERRRAAQLVHLQQGLLQRQARLLGSAARDDFGGLDRSQLNGRGGAGRVATDQGLAQAGETFGDLLAGLGTDLGAGKTISQHRGLGLKRLLEAPQPELGGLDLPVRDRAAKTQAFGPFKGLDQRRRPDLPSVQEGAARPPHTARPDAAR